MKIFGIVLMSVCFASISLARAKTDIVVMKNGDRLTFEIKRLEGGVLKADFDYVDGTVSIDWSKVARLESTALFLVQLQDGSTYSGRVVTPEALNGAPARMEIQEPETHKEPLTIDKS